jgi:pantoate--beta-alanine ligase
MKIVTNIKEWEKIRKTCTDKTVGLIPTMGHLHEGHLSLCRRAKSENDLTVVSIFINPTQFNQASDFERYPRTEKSDLELLEGLADFVFIPDPSSMYPDEYQIQVGETHLSHELEGEFRPGHFNGMLTIVLKLLNLVRPTRAYFGEKDFQQMLLVKKMTQALFLQTEIISCETIRAEDGLALSSRNSRLTPTQREKAKHFPELLNSSFHLDVIKEKLIQLGFKVDYIAEKWQRRLGAVWIDDVRLIDNFPIK